MEKLITTAMYARSTFIIIPLAFFCFIPVWQDAKSSPARLAAKVAAAFALMETVMFLIYFLFSSVIANIASAVLCIVIFFYLYQKEIALKRSHLWFIFMTACMIGGFTYLFYHLVNIFFHPAATVDDPAFTDTFFLQLAFESLLILILALPTRRYLGWLVHHFHEEKVWRVIWLIPASFLAFSYIFIPYDNSVMFVGRFLEVYIISIFIFFILILLIYVLFYKIAHSITENQKMALKTANLEIQAQQYHRLQSYVQETSRLRHDFRHQLTVLADMLKTQRYEELEHYLTQSIGSFTDMPLKYCSSSAVNAILNHYVSLCREFGIETRLNIRLKDDFSIEDIDFCVLLGNLLENAMDACKTLPEKMREITLKAGQTSEHVIALYISNPYEEPVSIKAGIFLSTKHEGEGQGLKSVRLIVEKYNGFLDIRHENKLFEVKCLLNI